MKKELKLIDFYISETEQIMFFIDDNSFKNRELNQKDLIRFENRMEVLKSIKKIIINS